MAKKATDLRTLFGQRVRELRRHRGLSLAALGERAGLDGKYVQTVETAKKSASIETIEKLAAGLGVPVAELFAVAEERPADARQRAIKLIQAVSDEDVRRMIRVLEALDSP